MPINLSGSLVLTGSIVATGGITMSGSIASASYASYTSFLNNSGSGEFVPTGSFNTFSSSILTHTGSTITRLNSIETVTGSNITRLGNIETVTGSNITRLNSLESKTGSYATTGSNTFIGTQTISGSVLQSGSFTTTGTIIAQTINVQTVTSSIVYSSGSNIFGNLLGDSQKFTGSVLITGSLTIAGGSSATSYSGATIFGSTIACSPIGCFATSCATSFIGGTMSGTTIYGSTAVCSAIGKFTTCLDLGGALTGTSAVFSSTNTATAFIPSGASIPTNGMYLSAANTVDFATNTTNRLTITSGGDVAIGADGNSIVKLLVRGKDSGSSNYAFIAQNSSTTNLFLVKNDGNVSAYGSISGTTIYGSTAVCSPVGKFTSCIDAGIGTFSGGVSIGTTNTTGKVSIQQTINDSGLYFFNCAATSRFMFNHYFGSGINSIVIQEFTTSNTLCRNILSIDAGGNVGINTVNNIYKLTVQNGDIAIGNGNQTSGDFSQAQAIHFLNETTIPLATIKAVRTNWAQGQTDLTFSTYNSGMGEKMRITSGGNVGVATSSPLAKVSISCFMGAALPYLDSTSNSFDFNGYYVGECNNGNTSTVGGLVLQNNLYCVGAYSPVIAFMSRSTSGAYSNSYAAIFGQVSGVGGDGNWTAGGLVFQTSDAYGPVERMRITAGGNVGIGTSSPLSLLQVGGVGNATVRLGTSSTTNTSSTYSFIAWNSSGADMLGVRGDGLVYMPFLVSAWTTGNAANMWANPSTGDIYRSTSSLKYKKNVENYTKGLAEVMQLRPVSYEGKHEVDAGKTFAGLIAEEVHELGLTEFVQYAEDGTPDALAYGNMVSLLVKGMQEQQCTINTLKTCLGII